MPLPTAMGHPDHLQVQNDLVTLPEELRWDQWVAQSFLANSSYNITRVSLFVMDIGPSDALEVAIRKDEGGLPGFSNLTQGSVDGPSFGNWVEVDLDPWVELTAEKTYWIVAHSNQFFGEGYGWWSSDNESAYPDGFGMASPDGLSWFPIDHDMTFRVYGFHQPNLTFSVTPSVTTLAPGGAVVYRIEFQNSGLGTSAALWVNVSLPTELRYVTDDAAAIGGNRSGAYSFEFQNVAPGSYVFNLTARAEGGVPDGTQALTQFTFDALDHNGALLTSSSQDVAVTIENAVLSYGASVTPTSLAPGEAAVFRLSFTNSGQGTAAGVWVNLTFPAELRYDSDDADAIGGNRSGAYSFEFLNVAPGTYIFNVTAIVEGGVPNGTVATTNVTFEARDLGGIALNQTARDFEITVGNAVLTLTLDSYATAQPGDTIVLTATVRNLGTESAENVRVDATVDANATYLTSTPTGFYDPLTRTIDWDLGTIGAGAMASVVWEIEIPLETPDGAFVRTLVRARGEDPTGSTLPRQENQSAIRVQAPVFVPVLFLDRADAERGDQVLAALYYNNTGSIAGPRAWINATLGGHYEVLSLNPDLPYTPTVDGFSMTLENVTVGAHLLEVRLLVVRGLEDGLSMGVQMEWTATDAKGNVLPPDSLGASVELRAPSVAMTLESSVTEAAGGSLFLLNLTLENVGRADAFGWLNLTLPSGTIYEGGGSALSVTAEGDRVSWVLARVPGASNLTLRVELRAGGDLGLRSFQFALDLTDGQGSTPASVQSDAVSVNFVAAPSPFTSLPWWLFLILSLGGLAVLGAVVARRRGGTKEISVEEVFVVDRGGALLGHRSNSILQYKDEDLVVAMLTAIQRYIEDVFSYGSGDTIRGLEFGERRILIEDGASHFVAIVYRGDDPSDRLRERARGLCATIDEQFGGILEDWKGDTAEVRGIAALLPHIWRKRPTKGSE